MNLAVLALAAALAGAAADPAATDALSKAKELYASAAYDDALAALARITGATPDAMQQVDEYRSLCLFALGRTDEAEAAVRDLVRSDPRFDISAQDLPPRVAAMFTDVRKQLLPGLARDRYRAARKAMDDQQFAAAESQLDDAREIIAEAERLGVKDDSLADLAVLADGFRELARATLAKAQAAAAAPKPVSHTVEAPPEQVRRGPYDASDAGVTPPVPLVQEIPPVPPALVPAMRRRQGLLELTIGADGRVEGAAMRQSLNSAYDEIVVSAARQWRYKPALKNGTPVAYVKAIAITFHDLQ